MSNEVVEQVLDNGAVTKSADRPAGNVSQNVPPIRSPGDCGVLIVDGETLLKMIAEDEEESHPVPNNFIEFCTDRGLKPVKFKNDDQTDYKFATPSVVVLLVWTDKPLLRECLTKLGEKIPKETPKLIIYCEVKSEPSNNSSDPSEDGNYTSGQSGCKNAFIIKKIDTHVKITDFIKEFMKLVQDAELKNYEYPDQYTSIRDVASSIEDTSMNIIDNLETPLRIEGYPISKCYLRIFPGMKEAVNRIRAANARGQRQLVQDTEDASLFRDGQMINENKLDGRVLIISNELFRNQRKKELRMSAGIDVDNLQFLFQDVLQYEKVEIKRNLTADEMKSSVEKFSNASEQKTVHGSFAILVILTHGTRKGLLGADWKIYKRKSLIDTFANAKGLEKKPKVLLIDACRSRPFTEQGKRRREISDTNPDDHVKDFGKYYYCTDGASVDDKQPDWSEFILAQSTSPGEKSWRLPISGSRFIGSLCYTWSQKAHQLDVVSMIPYVNYLMTHINEDDPQMKEKCKSVPQISSWTLEVTKLFYLTASGNQQSQET